MATTKRIPIDDLRPGMYVLELDQPWHKTPFLRHRFLIQDEEQIARLRQAAVLKVVIDLSRGCGAESGTASDDTSTIEPPEAWADGVDGSDLMPPPPPAELAAARQLRHQAVVAVQRVLEGIDTGVPLDRPALRGVVSGVMEHILGNQTALVTQVFLQQIQRFDDNLFGHVVDVCILSLIVGKDRGLDRQQLEYLGMGALLHDVGHLRLPRNLLRRRGSLSARETKLWEQHPQLGVTLLSQVGGVPEPIRLIVAQHHERLDGSGYPQALRGDELSSLSQIVGLLDTYDRLVSSRGGKPSLSPFLAVREVFELGRRNQFERVLVEQMVHSLGVYPVGTLVKLNTGERGVVVGLNREQRLKPLVRLVSDASGHPDKVHPCVDLAAADASSPERTILQALDPEQEQVNVADYLES